MAMMTRMPTGITVQMISALVLCTMVVSGLAPCDLRNATSDQIIQPNTNTPIATHHQKMVMCSEWISFDSSVTPTGMLRLPHSAWALREANAAALRARTDGTRRIALVMEYPIVH